MLAAVGCGMLSWMYPKQNVMLTGLRDSHLSHQAQQENPLYFRQKQINRMFLSIPQPLPSGAGLGVEGTGLGLQNNS